MAGRAGSTTGGWGRRRLLGILVAGIAVAASLAGGLIYALVLAVGGPGSDTVAAVGPASGVAGRLARAGSGGAGRAARGAAHRDRVAAARMVSVPADAMLPAEADDPAPVGIEIPTGQVLGPAQILTGFPRTPGGAIGQLAQIDLGALQALSVPVAREVYRGWALPGGIGPDRWRITRGVRAFLAAGAMGEASVPGSWVEVEPAAGLVKGTDGPDWVTACVLLKVTAGYRGDGRVGFGHCERMQWAGGRWMVAPGPPPAPAPSTWPGTAAANRAGWRPWITAR
jgi:hypothetical protein